MFNSLRKLAPKPPILKEFEYDQDSDAQNFGTWPDLLELYTNF